MAVGGVHHQHIDIRGDEGLGPLVLIDADGRAAAEAAARVGAGPGIAAEPLRSPIIWLMLAILIVMYSLLLLRGRSVGATGQTATSIVERPPIHSDAAERCTQSATSVFHVEPVSTASWPESERPLANPSASASAGTRKGVGRSVSQAR